MSHRLAEQVDRAALLQRFTTTRERSRRLFDVLTPDAYYARPIRLRHPIVFYEGHLAAFNFNTLVKRALGGQGIDERLERLFARGIDPEDDREGSRSQPGRWPTRQEVRAFADEADRRVADALASEPIEQPGHPLLDRAEAAHVILEHEAMHQETMQYLWHELPYWQKHPVDNATPDAGVPPPPEKIAVPAGSATLGARRGEIPFGWDNEFDAVAVSVPGFDIDRYNVTNADFLEFVEAGGYADERWWTREAFAWIRTEGIAHPHFWSRENDRWWWRGMFRPIPLPDAWPVFVSQSEAAAFARWRGERLPTEPEIVRALFGTPSGVERQHPWGDDEPDQSRGRFDFAGWSPEPVGRSPLGRSAWGVDDLVGNGWEWTSSLFGPLPGFRPMPSYPEYSADFFDGQHYVMRGASHATDRHLLRRSFRNWFRPHYPYVYATFRCVSSRAA
jgi:ergothioneine biosynthesis protein EgtB